jgi:hypothetical protein
MMNEKDPISSGEVVKSRLGIQRILQEVVSLFRREQVSRQHESSCGEN